MSSFAKRCCRNSPAPIQASIAFLLPMLLATLFLASPTFNLSRAFAQTDDGNLDLSVLEDDVPAPSTEGDLETNEVNGNAAPSSTSAGNVQFFELVKASGWIGVVLLALSVVAVTIVIRLCLTLKISGFVPEKLKQSVSQALTRNDAQAALDAAAAFPSYAGNVLTAGLRESYRGWNAIEKATEDASSSLTAKLYRATEPLSLIGNVAPMLGLLGTVMGMVSTFGELAVADGSGRNLANGIYFALVTTVAGLLVAIPVLVAHSLINARLASLISLANEEVFKLLEPLRRSTQTIVASGGAPQQSVRPVRGLQEIPRDNDSVSPYDRDDMSTRPSGRPSLSLKNRRPDGE